MNLTPEDDALLRGWVKTSRQRTVHLKWTDRDGTPRLTPLTPAEATRLNQLARAEGLGAEAFLRAVAHLPPPPPPARVPASAP